MESGPGAAEGEPTTGSPLSLEDVGASAAAECPGRSVHSRDEPGIVGVLFSGFLALDIADEALVGAAGRWAALAVAGASPFLASIGLSEHPTGRAVDVIAAFGGDTGLTVSDVAPTVELCEILVAGAAGAGAHPTVALVGALDVPAFGSGAAGRLGGVVEDGAGREGARAVGWAGAGGLGVTLASALLALLLGERNSSESGVWAVLDMASAGLGGDVGRSPALATALRSRREARFFLLTESAPTSSSLPGVLGPRMGPRSHAFASAALPAGGGAGAADGGSRPRAPTLGLAVFPAGAHCTAAGAGPARAPVAGAAAGACPSPFSARTVRSPRSTARNDVSITRHATPSEIPSRSDDVCAVRDSHKAAATSISTDAPPR